MGLQNGLGHAEHSALCAPVEARTYMTWREHVAARLEAAILAAKVAEDIQGREGAGPA